MKKLIWESFRDDKLRKILMEKDLIIDIGAGLKAWRNKGDRFYHDNWPSLEKVKVMDPVPDYNPDIIGDIHKMPFNDDSVDAVICHAVLEHVENPLMATEEIYRVLKRGGYCYIYVPFLYYYHAERGYYKDYWRFSRDALELLFKNFSNAEFMPVRGAISTLVNLTPLASKLPSFRSYIDKVTYAADKLFGKIDTHQVSGYCVFLTK